MIRFLTAGESHGPALVGIVEGVPAGLALRAEHIDHQLARRQQGHGRGNRMKIETDRARILSGVRFGLTLGSPVSLLVENRDWKNWTEKMAVEAEPTDVTIKKVTIPRPGHADLAGMQKYRFDDIRNVLERSSARETTMRVALNAVCRQMLRELGIRVGSHVVAIGPDGRALDRTQPLPQLLELLDAGHAESMTDAADRSPVRMLDPAAETAAIAAIDRAKKAGDTLGGIFEVIVTGLPIGLGSYVHWDRKLDGRLAQAILSINAVKGVEFGLGFEAGLLPGSQVHDAMTTAADGRAGDGIGRLTNRAGGTEGGMTNGEPLVLRAVMKPIATLMNPLGSVDTTTGAEAKAHIERSDTCAVPACAVIAENAICAALADAVLEKFGGDSMAEILERWPTSLV